MGCQLRFWRKLGWCQRGKCCHFWPGPLPKVYRAACFTTWHVCIFYINPWDKILAAKIQHDIYHIQSSVAYANSAGPGGIGNPQTNPQGIQIAKDHEHRWNIAWFRFRCHHGMLSHIGKCWVILSALKQNENPRLAVETRHNQFSDMRLKHIHHAETYFNVFAANAVVMPPSIGLSQKLLQFWWKEIQQFLRRISNIRANC